MEGKAGIMKYRIRIKDNSVELTKNQQEFIGSQFPTPKGGVITVVGVWGRKGRSIYFETICSVCSQDTELWPVGTILDTKGHIISGRVTCGCGYNTRWSKYQYEIRIKRECNKRGYEFLGFHGEWKGVKTHLSLFNTATQNTWNSTSIDNFFSGNEDPAIKTEKIRKLNLLDDNIHIDDFRKAGFGDQYKFWRSSKVDKRGLSAYWNYTCTICSNDEYVKNGLCTGIFESFVGSLKCGLKSCRCSNSTRYTLKQREYLIKKTCDEEELTFIGWIGKNVSSITNNSKFKWKCNKGHTCVTCINSFIHSRSRCTTCHKIRQKVEGYMNGYYPHRSEEKDYLYCILFKKGRYIKVGRSFDIKDRLQHKNGLLIKSKHKIDEIEILRVMTSTHKNIYEVEQEIHRELTERGFYHYLSKWTIETFDTDCLHILNELVAISGLEEVPLTSIKQGAINVGT